jgi:hypothetical protein
VEDGAGPESEVGYGYVGTQLTTPLDSSTYLQLDGGIDLEQSTSADVAGGAGGRVGLGFRY